MKRTYRIGEVAKLYEVSPDTLRYYEDLGLIAPTRLESGYREYHLRDVWRLNTIRELRQLGFSMEQIAESLDHHNLATTKALLQKEQAVLGEQLARLQKIQKNLQTRMELLEEAERRPCGEIALETLPERRFFAIAQGYQEDCEMDVLMKRLTNLDRDHCYIIGSNQLGSVIPEADAREGRVRYRAVFLLDGQGDQTFPAGTWLTVTYKGGYSGTKVWLDRLLAWTEAHGYEVDGDLLELLWIEIHTTEDEQEHRTELQLKVRKRQPDCS